MNEVASLLVGVGAALWAAAAALGLLATTRPLLWASSLVSTLGGIAAGCAGVLVALAGSTPQLALGAGSLVGGCLLQLTPTAAVFLVLLGLVAVAIGLYAPRYHHAGRATAPYLCVYNLALLASVGVLVAASVTAFLVAWETMTLLCYLMILRHHTTRGVPRRAFLFLAVGELGFMLIVAAFALLVVRTGSLDLPTIAVRAGGVATGWRNAIFVLALLGFSCKAGMVPFHVWLPEAHPVAPADGSAFLSGLIIKLGVYGVLLFGFRLLGPGPAWWGVLTIMLGAVTAGIGVLYAVVERDFKRLLAYHSIENIGIIITAIGAAMIFRAYGQMALVALLVIAALYHVVNHGTYKTLLFLEAGVIEHATGTRDLDHLGGLVRRLPATTAISLIGTLGIAGLPPLNGFVSEWLIFQGLFQGFRIQPLAGVVIVLAGATLALSGGLAVLAFAHAFGIGFLGQARSAEVARAAERRQPIVGPGVLAVGCVALSIGAPAVLFALDRVSRSATGVELGSALLAPNLTVLPAHADFAAFSPTYLALFGLCVTAVPIAIFFAGRPRGPSSKAPVWDGGIVAFKPRMQYTGSTFANPVRVTFDAFYRPDSHVERASDDPAGRSGPVRYDLEVLPIFQRYLYDPVVRCFEWLAGLLRPIQSGDVNLYLAYIFGVVIVAYLLHLINT